MRDSICPSKSWKIRPAWQPKRCCLELRLYPRPETSLVDTSTWTEARFTHSGGIRKLPTKYAIHEWDIMREFAESVEPERLSDELQNAIRGAGAFRYFKDTLRRYRREKDWYAYREEALRQIAIEWCEENGIEYTES